MNVKTKALLTGIFGIIGAVMFLALVVYPFQYGMVEGALLVGVLVPFGIVEFVLGETTFDKPKPE